MVALKEEKNGGGEIDLVRLFQILWKGKWIILVVALIFGIVAAIYAYTSKRFMKPVSPCCHPR